MSFVFLLYLSRNRSWCDFTSPTGRATSARHIVAPMLRFFFMPSDLNPDMAGRSVMYRVPTGHAKLEKG